MYRIDMYVCVCLACPHLPPRAHPHSPTHTHARGACPVCLCVLLLPPQGKHTPLHIAAIKGHKDVAELLLGHKADVNSVGNVSADGLCFVSRVFVMYTYTSRECGWGWRWGRVVVFFCLGVLVCVFNMWVCFCV